MSIPINYTFIRHSNSNGNILGSMISNKIVTVEQANHLVDNVLIDPELSQIGGHASVINGQVIADVLKQQNIKYVNVVCCSTLLRSMISVYYLTRKWEIPPKKIFVMGHLREIDEGSDNKWSKESVENVDLISSYKMKPLNEQKKILQKLGIIDMFDFSFVESSDYLRHSLGDIPNFIKWTKQNILDKVFQKSTIPTSYHFYIITHAGVLSDYTQLSFPNNTGIIVKSIYYLSTNNLDTLNFINLRPLLEADGNFVDSYTDKKSVHTNAPAFKKLLGMS